MVPKKEINTINNVIKLLEANLPSFAVAAAAAAAFKENWLRFLLISSCGHSLPFAPIPSAAAAVLVADKSSSRWITGAAANGLFTQLLSAVNDEQVHYRNGLCLRAKKRGFSKYFLSKVL